MPPGRRRRQGAERRKAAALSPGTVSTPTARPGAQGQGLGHPGDPLGRRPSWGSGRAEDLSRRPALPPGFGPLSWDCFLLLRLSAWARWHGQWPECSPQRPGRTVAAAGGSSLASLGVRPAPCAGGGGWPEPLSSSRPRFSAWGPTTPRERETLAHAHFTAESTEAPEAPCVGGGTPIPQGAHALGPRGLRQGRRGCPQALGPGLPVRPSVHGGPLHPERALPLGRPARPTDSRGFFLNWSSVEP